MLKATQKTTHVGAAMHQHEYHATDAATYVIVDGDDDVETRCGCTDADRLNNANSEVRAARGKNGADGREFLMRGTLTARGVRLHRPPQPQDWRATDTTPFTGRRRNTRQM